MKWVRFSLAAAAFLTLVPCTTRAALPQLELSDNRRFFVKADGTTFFYLGDTAWGLFAHTTREDVDHYLEDRASKGFTVVEAVVVLWDGLRRRNPYGQLPLIDGDPTKPNEAYFEHVDYAINQAEAHGLYVAVLPS